MLLKIKVFSLWPLFSVTEILSPSIFSNIFCSEPIWPIEAIFHSKSQRVWGSKVCSDGIGHMIKIRAQRIL